MTKRTFLPSLFLALLAVATVVAQDPPAATSTADTAATATDGDMQQTLEEILEEPTTTDTYRYDPQGRRDPFRSLIGPTTRTMEGERPPGIAGFLIDEIKLQGVFTTRQGLTAMVGGPDNKGYQLRVGDKVMDGEVIRITRTSIVFRQEVNDPTRIERYREVVKDLAPEAVRR
jgi:type IV pilus assembly protein PilP